MRKWIAIFFIATVVVACSRNTVSTKSTAATTETAKVDAAHAALIENGKTIYTAKCGRCHGLKNTADFTVAEWVPILKNMAPKAKLTDIETSQVQAYVTANAKK